jgi:hypothetical protein
MIEMTCKIKEKITENQDKRREKEVYAEDLHFL